MLGISIRPRFEKSERSSSHAGTFEFFIADQPRNTKTFVSNPQIREQLEKVIKKYHVPRRIKIGLEPFGDVMVLFFPERKRLSFKKYHPLGFTHEAAHSLLLGKGIGELLEFRVLELAERRFGKIRGIKHTFPSDARKAQLRKRGIRAGRTYGSRLYAFARGKNLLRWKIARDKLKAKYGEERAAQFKIRYTPQRPSSQRPGRHRV